MEKKIGSINVTETDSGYRIEVEGKDLKDVFGGCCCVATCCTDKDKDKSKESNCCS